MPIATDQEAAVPYPEWRERYLEGLREDAEAATLEKVPRREAGTGRSAGRGGRLSLKEMGRFLDKHCIGYRTRNGPDQIRLHKGKSDICAAEQEAAIPYPE